MPRFICKACGVLRPESPGPPARCPICEDPRQFVPKGGQAWTTPEALAAAHANSFREVAPGLLAITTTPHFAIGQRALLVLRPGGNILWDCVSLLDPATTAIVRALGGLAAIALSHPHFYSVMADWGRVFGCPVYAHEADRDWIADPDPALRPWSGDRLEIAPGATLHRLGGHFPGNTVLHLAERRALLTGDTVLVAQDRRHVSFMWSYPNYVPLPASEVARIAGRFQALDFDTVHAAFLDRGDLVGGAKEAVARSARRHIEGPGIPMDVPSTLAGSRAL